MDLARCCQTTFAFAVDLLTGQSVQCGSVEESIKQPWLHESYEAVIRVGVHTMDAPSGQPPQVSGKAVAGHMTSAIAFALPDMYDSVLFGTLGTVRLMPDMQHSTWEALPAHASWPLTDTATRQLNLNNPQPRRFVILRCHAGAC